MSEVASSPVTEPCPHCGCPVAPSEWFEDDKGTLSCTCCALRDKCDPNDPDCTCRREDEIVQKEEDVQFCSFCSEPFPADDPMVDYDGQTFCSPDCVREMLNNDSPCDHAAWVTAVQKFDARLTRIMEKPQGGGQ